MQHAFPLVLLAICGLFVTTLGIHFIVIRPIRRAILRCRSKREFAELKLSLR